MNFIIEQSNEKLTSLLDLVLVGALLNKESSPSFNLIFYIFPFKSFFNGGITYYVNKD